MLLEMLSPLAPLALLLEEILPQTLPSVQILVAVWMQEEIMEDIAITGLGVISSLGHNADDRGLQNGIATYLPDDLRAVSFHINPCGR